MNEIDYLINTKKTLSTTEDLLEHMAYGLITESAEIMDALKKHKFYGRELDVRNLKEEIGDIMWYLYQMLDELNYTPDDCREDNILKLSKRYPNCFKDVKFRDADIELSHIEG
jgi:NTP pyrophosphatase (non-canonical NTP hydrolase)